MSYSEYVYMMNQGKAKLAVVCLIVLIITRIVGKAKYPNMDPKVLEEEFSKSGSWFVIGLIRAAALITFIVCIVKIIMFIYRGY